MRGAALELIALTKAYGTTVAVDRSTSKIAAGTYCCLLGPSGCGKTSTLRMIAGHEAATSGDIVLGGRQRHGPAARQARHGDDVPELRAVPASVRARQRRLQPQDGGRRQGRRATPRRTTCCELVAMARLRRAPAGAAVGRPAAARRARPRAHHRAADPAAGRAALRARSLPARQDARRAQAAAEGARHLLHPRDAQPGRGDGAGRPDRGHERAAGSSRWARRARSSTARDRVRRPLHGRPQRHRRARRA